MRIFAPRPISVFRIEHLPVEKRDEELFKVFSKLEFGDQKIVFFKRAAEAGCFVRLAEVPFRNQLQALHPQRGQTRQRPIPSLPDFDRKVSGERDSADGVIDIGPQRQESVRLGVVSRLDPE